MTEQTVLLVHSGGFSSRQWKKLAAALEPGYRVVAPDLLGYGTSGPWPDGQPFHFRQDLALIESLLDRPAHLVGHSYGGFLALQLAISRPDLVTSLAVFEPVAFGVLDDVEDAEARAGLTRVKTRWEPDASGVDEDWLGQFIEWWNGPGAWNRLPEETKRSFRSVGWKVFQEVITLGADRTSSATYGTIRVPTLILGGMNSPLTERRVVEKLGTALPHATARLLPGVGHMGPISHAAVVNAAIVEHVRASSRTQL